MIRVPRVPGKRGSPSVVGKAKSVVSSPAKASSSVPASKKVRGGKSDASQRGGHGKSEAVHSKCVCEACGCTPGPSREWHEHVDNAKKCPKGSKCEACCAMRESVFSHLEWPEFCEHVNTTQGKKDVEDYKQFEATGNADWLLDSVDAEMDTTVTVSRSFIVLSEKEYKAETGKDKPTVRGPVVHSVRLPCELTGQEMDHYVFKDPERRFRRLDISTSMRDTRRTHRLQPSQHQYEAQGEQLHAAGRAHTLEKSAVKKKYCRLA